LDPQRLVNKELKGNNGGDLPPVLPSQESLPAELKEIVEKWSDLPSYIRQAICILASNSV
jgi:hypothetical protein